MHVLYKNDWLIFSMSVVVLFNVLQECLSRVTLGVSLLPSPSWLYIFIAILSSAANSKLQRHTGVSLKVCRGAAEIHRKAEK